MRTVNEYAADVKRHYIEACEAVLGRGGNIPSGMPMSDLPLAISNIPHDVTLAYHEVNSTAYRTLVPQKAEPYAQVNKIGGKSYKTRNLIPFSYDGQRTHNGITYTVNADGSVTANGTATAQSRFVLKTNVPLLPNTAYTLSGGPKVNGARQYIDLYRDGKWEKVFYNYIEPVTFTTEDGCTYDAIVNIVEGTTVDNLTFYPMLNEGDTALPYEPFFEGIRDTKITALVSEGESSELIDTLAIPEAVRSIYGYGWGVNETFNSYINPPSGKFTRHTERQLVKDSEITAQSINDKPFLYIILQNTPYGDPFGYGVCDKFEIVREYASEISLVGQALISPYANGVYLRTDMSVADFKTQYADTVIEYALAEPVVTDISEYLTDEYIKVEGGGTITAVNEHEEGVPTSVTYLIETVGG